MGACGGSDSTLYISPTGSSTFTGGHFGHSGHSTLHQPEVTLLPEVTSVFGHGSLRSQSQVNSTRKQPRRSNPAAARASACNSRQQLSHRHVSRGGYGGVKQPLSASPPKRGIRDLTFLRTKTRLQRVREGHYPPRLKTLCASYATRSARRATSTRLSGSHGPLRGSWPFQSTTSSQKKIQKDPNACMRPASGGCQSASGRGPRTASEGRVSFVPGTCIISSFPEIGSCTEKHWP